MELIRRFGFEEPKSVSLDETIESAKERSEKTYAGVVGKDDIVKE